MLSGRIAAAITFLACDIISTLQDEVSGQCAVHVSHANRLDRFVISGGKIFHGTTLSTTHSSDLGLDGHSQRFYIFWPDITAQHL